jgi:hypothetical protein
MLMSDRLGSAIRAAGKMPGKATLEAILSDQPTIEEKE